jgi:tetratricopeptide (TPR) repeat protein
MRSKNFVLLITVTLISLGAGIADADLVAHWKLDEQSGTVASDSSGNGHNGRLMGGMSFDKNSVVGVIGNALDFDGRDDYIVAETVSLSPNAFTIALWFNPDSNLDNSSNRMDIVYWGGRIKPHGDKPYLTFNKFKTGEVRLFVSVVGVEYSINTTTNSWQGSTWYHIAATFDGAELKIYVNGALENTAAHPGRHHPSSSVYFGIRTDGQYAFDGKLDDIRIYDHALTGDEIAQLGNLSPTLRKLIGEVREAEVIVKKQSPEEATAFLEKTISECEQWRDKNPNDTGLYYKTMFSDLYFFLAKVKEKSGLPKEDIVAAYEHAVSAFNNGGAAFVWLFANVSAERYGGIVKTFVRNNTPECQNISKQFESCGNWQAFKAFLDVVFNVTENPLASAKSIGKGLNKEGVWKRQYLEYCRDKANLTEYIFEKDCEIAETYITKSDFKNAADVYRNILKQCLPNQDKSGLEFKICRCIFDGGDYQNAINELNSFIVRNKANNERLMKDAMLMICQCYIHLGEADKALNELSRLANEYPQMKQTPELGFSTGYCYMLQGSADKATEAFNLVVQNYPQSSYANKAKLCLVKIKNTPESEKK